MTNTLGVSLSLQMQKLKEIIERNNEQANLQGLFAHHILKDVPEFKTRWSVECSDEWVETTFDQTNVYNVSSLSYTLQTNNKATEKFIKALDLLKKRDHFKGPHLSFPFNPSAFLGIVLGAISLTDEACKKRTIEWLTGLLDKRVSIAQIPGFNELFYKYIEHFLKKQTIQITDTQKYSSLEELSFLEYGIMKSLFQAPHPEDNLKRIRKELLKQLIQTEISGMEAEKAALIWYAANQSITNDIETILISPSHVSAILSRFEDAMRRWRYDTGKTKKEIRWPVTQEREVQDIVWLILRSYFNDLVDEESLPKFGHSSYKPDFGIPSLNLLIEVKVAYKKEDFKKIEKEIMEDIVGYLINTNQYKKIIAFIYDKSGSVQEHNTTRNALIKIDAIEDVIIVSKPSHIP